LQTFETSALLGSILSVVHPQLYNTGVEALKALSKNEHLVFEEGLRDILLLWSSPFSGYSLICNRLTPPHRDAQGCTEGFDLLATAGRYIGARFKLPDIGLSFDYHSGTVVAILGRVIRHQVTAHKGDRVVLACYMRDSVLARLDIPAPPFMHEREWGDFANMVAYHEQLEQREAEASVVSELMNQWINMSQMAT